MIDNEIYIRLCNVICDNLLVDIRSFTIDSNLRDDLGADSLDRHELYFLVEKEFGIYIPDHKAMNFETVRDIYDFIKEESNED